MKPGARGERRACARVGVAVCTVALRVARLRVGAQGLLHGLLRVGMRVGMLWVESRGWRLRVGPLGFRV